MAPRTRMRKLGSSEDETTTADSSEAEEAPPNARPYATRSRVKHVADIPLPRNNRPPRQRSPSTTDPAAAVPPTNDDAEASTPTPRHSHIARGGARPHFPGDPPQTMSRGGDDPPKPALKQQKPPRPLPKRVYGARRDIEPAPSERDATLDVADESASSRQPGESRKDIRQVSYPCVILLLSTLTGTCTGLCPGCFRTLRRSRAYLSPSPICGLEPPTSSRLGRSRGKRQGHHVEDLPSYYHSAIQQALIGPATISTEINPSQGRVIPSTTQQRWQCSLNPRRDGQIAWSADAHFARSPSGEYHPDSPSYDTAKQRAASSSAAEFYSALTAKPVGLKIEPYPLTPVGGA